MRLIIFWLLLLPLAVAAQHSQQPSASDIKLRLRKLNMLGSVLYVAAHPDDENTRLITSFANDRLAATAYLSLTRGDGGQNLIGPEIRDVLGLIRTQELLAARRIDGGQQFFSRANDFGFSKSAAEALRLWGKDEVLHDVVKVYRQYQPDVIITRFPPDERAGHGHHTASAMLAQEAFEVSAKKDSYAALAGLYGTWQPKRLYTNTGRWWNTTINENTPGIITVDVGGYNALLGESYTEIAALSRSQHKSQGFGSGGTRGEQFEFLEHVQGEKAGKDIFEGINTTWTRLKGGDKIQPLVQNIIQKFNEDNPAASVPDLFVLRKAIAGLEESVWKARKFKETEQLIQDCLGLYIDPTAKQYWTAPGEPVKINIEMVNRSPLDITLQRISAAGLSYDSSLALPLKSNAVALVATTKSVNGNAPYSDPYWLKLPHSIGLFSVPADSLIGKPENAPAISLTFQLKVHGEVMEITKPLRYTWIDPVKGEQARPFEIVPPVFVNLSDHVIIFPDEKPKAIQVLLKSSSEKPVQGNVMLQLPEGWTAVPASVSFELSKRGDEKAISFQVTPSAGEITSVVAAKVVVGGKSYDQSIQLVGYDHIPTQTLLPKAEAKVVRLAIHHGQGMIGYIKGAGDDIPNALRNLGYGVWEMKNEEITYANLKRLDAVVLGIRALNTNERLRYVMNDLLEYVKNGGTLVVQYNTPLEANSFSPYPFTLSRDRVTEEDADVSILKPGHRVLHYPNTITQRDFDGWVQERGLYYPSQWDNHYEAILSMHDAGETAKDGSLLVAQYGSGYYVYTGLSFFRELPEGVAGAYKLFSNLVSLSQADSSARTGNSAGKPRKKR